MAIQMRRGSYGDYDPSKLMPGEWAVVLDGDESTKDGMAVYICFSAGTAKRMATYEDMVESIVNSVGDVSDAITDALTSAVERATTVTESAEDGEAQRVEAEKARQEAELKRAESESGRASAEEERESAEERRVDEFERMKHSTVTPILTSDIDDMLGGGEMKGNEVLTADGMGHLWSQLANVTVGSLFGGD